MSGAESKPVEALEPDHVELELDRIVGGSLAWTSPILNNPGVSAPKPQEG